MELPPASEPRSGLGLLYAQSRILEALADGTVLHGTAEALIARLGVSTGAFRLALLDLVAGGWVYTAMTREGALTIGRERRVHDRGPRGGVERRRSGRPAATSRWEHADHAASTLYS